MSLLDVCKLILVLQEALAAALAHGDGHIRHHVLEEPSWLIGAELGVVHDEYLLVSHLLQHTLVHFNWPVVVWVHLVLKLLQHALGEQIVLNVILMVIEGKCLLITLHSILLPPILVPLLSFLHSGKVLSGILWRVHPEALDHLLVGEVRSWYKLHQG